MRTMLASVFAVLLSISSATFEAQAAAVRPQPLAPGDGALVPTSCPFRLETIRSTLSCSSRAIP
jgi:hypothetical protein